MGEDMVLTYQVDSDDFTRAGEASSSLKRTLKQLGIPADIIRRISIVMYEGEINMVIHAHGGTITVTIGDEGVEMVLKDTGPGIPDIEKAMQAGWSTASEEVRAQGFGAGMGLPNMKKNADTFHIDTVLGVGTTVTAAVHF
ncbi:MAG TPA: ATP-binding protein [Firmicutes bacterium]|nr:ATP-binding protein [Bacillota bacterium]